MTRRRRGWLAGTAWLLAVGCADAPSGVVPASGARGVQAAKAPSGDAPVLSELPGGGSDPALDIGSDQPGAYRNGVDGVTSVVQMPLGDWLLDLSGRTSTRSARIDLSDPALDNVRPAPFASALVRPRIIAKASQLRSGGITGMVGLGSTMHSPVSLAFAYAGKSYGLRMNPASHAPTDWAVVRCVGVADPNAPATSSCTQWELTPSGTYDGVAKNVGYLEEVTSKGATFVGHYRLTFRVVVTR